MAGKDTDSGMNSDERHVYGPRPVGALMPRLTRPTFRRRAPATAQVLDGPIERQPYQSLCKRHKGLSNQVTMFS